MENQKPYASKLTNGKITRHTLHPFYMGVKKQETDAAADLTKLMLA